MLISINFDCFDSWTKNFKLRGKEPAIYSLCLESHSLEYFQTNGVTNCVKPFSKSNEAGKPFFVNLSTFASFS